MNRFVRKILLAGTVLGSAFAGGPGCADNASTIFIRQAQVPTLGTAGTGCTVTATVDTLTLPGGTLDVAISTRYHATLLVGNQMVAQGNPAQLHTETSRVALQGTEVRLEDSGGNTIAGPFSVPGTGFIDPASGTAPSFGLLDTVLIDPSTGRSLATELAAQPTRVRRLTAIAKAFGTTLGGQSVESGEWTFPITVCYGCLVSFPAGSDDLTLSTQPNCDGSLATGTAPVIPCDPGQDVSVDCRICKAYAADQTVCNP